MRRTLLGAAAGSVLTLLATQLHFATADANGHLTLFGKIFERVRTNYVEKPDDTKLIESTINGMLNALDPHSSYLNAQTVRVTGAKGRARASRAGRDYIFNPTICDQGGWRAG